MWRYHNNDEKVASGDGKQVESSQNDSGFLSSGNLVSSELSAEIKEASAKSMRVDSGVDVGLSESLSQLTLDKQVDSIHGVQPEPTLELTPVTIPRKEEADLICQEEAWKLYFSQDDEGDTQLHIAIVQGFLEAAFSLIRMAPHPCLLDVLNDDGQSPLHLAVLCRQPTVVRRLVLAGATPSLRNSRGNTALHLACATNDLASAKALTDPLSSVERTYLAPDKRVPALPQNLEQRNYDGETCLHIAAMVGQVEMVQLLLRHGADLEAREGLSGRTPLHLAVERGRRDVVLFLLQKCRPCLDTPTYAGITAYQIAICIDGQLARELVRLGATPRPLPESDSEDDYDDEDTSCRPLMTLSLRRNALRLRV